MSEVSKEKRLSSLRKMHFKALHDLQIVPMVAAPYVSLASCDWQHNLSKFYANNPLWVLRHKGSIFQKRAS